MKLALISDLHASLVQFEAVLADAARVGVDRFICLGDLMDLGPQPSALLLTGGRDAGQRAARIGRRVRLFALGVTVRQHRYMRPEQDRKTNEFLDDVDDPVVVSGGAHPAGIVEFAECLGDAGLVGDREHPRPAAEDAQRVDGVERLGAAADLHDGERPPLRRPDSVEVQRQVIDLRLHEPGDLPVTFRAAPDLAFGPGRQVAKLVYRRMVVVRHLVRERQVRRIEDARLRAEVSQQPGGFLDHQPRVGARAQRPVQQEDSRRMPGQGSGFARQGAVGEAGGQRREMIGIG
jgi:hypothetical protein